MVVMRIKGIKRVTVRKRGKLYVYYRHRATGKVVKSEFGTADFAAAAARLDAQAENKVIAPGSLGELIARYRASEEYRGRALRTRKDYAKVFDYLEPCQDMPLLSITTRFIYEARDRAFGKHKRRFSTYVIQVFRLLLEWGRERQFLEGNPAKGVKAIRRARGAPKANRAWTDQEREAVLSAAPKALRVPVALGMFAGLREGDAIRLPWSCYDKTAIATAASKNDEPLWIPAHFRLRQILEAADKKSPVIAVNSRGQPWTESGFRASFFKFLRKLEARGLIGKGLTYHGLRHTVGKLIIEAGGDTRDVQAILGHRSAVSSEHYSREADMRKRATTIMRKMENKERKRMDKQADNSSVVSVVHTKKV